jgi:hypothetical protein
MAASPVWTRRTLMIGRLPSVMIRSPRRCGVLVARGEVFDHLHLDLGVAALTVWTM